MFYLKKYNKYTNISKGQRIKASYAIISALLKKKIRKSSRPVSICTFRFFKKEMKKERRTRGKGLRKVLTNRIIYSDPDIHSIFILHIKKDNIINFSFDECCCICSRTSTA